jgi:hypothetical protein
MIRSSTPASTSPMSSPPSDRTSHLRDFGSHWANQNLRPVWHAQRFRQLGQAGVRQR